MLARHLVLVGLMGTGKSTVARRVGQRLGHRVVDLDALVEERSGCTIAELFASRGEMAFRHLETQALTDALGEPDPTVIATGGGVVVQSVNRDLLRHARQARVVWLDATPEVLARRVTGGATVRPLLADDPLGALRQLDHLRRPWYAEVADHRVDTEAGSLSDVAESVLAWWCSEVPAEACTVEESR